MRTLVLALAAVSAASGTVLAGEVSLRWGRPIHRCLDSIQGGRAAEVAANLDSRMRQGLDLSEERLKSLESHGLKTLSDLDALLRRSGATAAGETRHALERVSRSFHAMAPAIKHLEDKGLTPDSLTPQAASRLAEALEAHSRKANLRAREIAEGFSKASGLPAAVIRDASEAQELVYRQYPYLEDLAWHRLLQIYEDLESRGKIARRKLIQEGIAARRSAALQIARADRGQDWQVRDAVASAPSPRSLVERARSKCRSLVNRLRRLLLR